MGKGILNSTRGLGMLKHKLLLVENMRCGVMPHFVSSFPFLLCPAYCIRHPSTGHGKGGIFSLCCSRIYNKFQHPFPCVLLLAHIQTPFILLTSPKNFFFEDLTLLINECLCLVYVYRSFSDVLRIFKLTNDCTNKVIY